MAITVGAGALGSVCEHCVDEMAGYVAEGREHVLGEFRRRMVERGIPVESLEWVRNGKQRRLRVTSPAVHGRGSAAVLEAVQAIVESKNGLPIQMEDIVVLPSTVEAF